MKKINLLKIEVTTCIKRTPLVLKIIFTYICTFNTFNKGGSVLEYMPRVWLLCTCICRKYMNDVQPRYFQGNPQNYLTAVTEHVLSFYLDIITGERSEPENFLMRIQKWPLIMQKILKCCSLRYIFWKFQGGLDPRPPDPPPPLDPRLSPRGGGLRQKIILTEGQQGEHHSACYLGIELGFGVFWPMVCTLPAVFVFVFLLLMDIFYIDCSSHVYSSASVNLIKI